jgi:hypothetical protein
MPMSTAAANQMLDAFVAGAVNYGAYIAAHTGAPGTTGANEYAGVTRQAATWNAGSGGTKTNSNAITLSTSGTTPVTDFGEWSAVSAGAYGAALHLTSPITAATITIAAGALSMGLA